MVQPGQYVGVLSPWDLYFTSLKREALFFDVLAIPGIKAMIGSGNLLSTCPIRALEFLIDNEIVVDPVEQYIGTGEYLRKIGRVEYEQRLGSIKERVKELIAEFSKPLPENKKKEFEGTIESFALSWKEFVKKLPLGVELGFILPLQKVGAFGSLLTNKIDYDRRGIAYDLRQNHGINAYPTASSSFLINNELLDGKDQIVRVIVNSLPEPNFETTSWEQIIDFRDDVDLKCALLELRNWCNEIAKGQITGFQIAEKLEYLINKYEQHLRVHKAKIEQGFWETFLMIPVEMLEGLLQLKPTQVIKALFTIKHRKVQLNQTELAAPGREIAYILKAREYFQENDGS